MKSLSGTELMRTSSETPGKNVAGHHRSNPHGLKTLQFVLRSVGLITLCGSDATASRIAVGHFMTTRLFVRQSLFP
jgi:hypothetical protein